MKAILVDPIKQIQIPLEEAIIETCNKLEASANELGSLEALGRIRKCVYFKKNDANWLRENYANLKSMEDMVRAQCELWKEN